MSVFLMGCYDEVNNRWCTVTKVHTGHDDATLEKLQVAYYDTTNLAVYQPNLHERKLYYELTHVYVIEVIIIPF